MTTTTNLESLRNSGIALLNQQSAPQANAPSTVIVVGVARSGTSMIATCLRALGVFMGDRIGDAVHEDVEMAEALEQGDQGALKQLIDRRNDQHNIWGFKRPMAFGVIGDYIHMFRSPRFVVTFRDPVAIAKRNELSMNMDFLRALNLARSNIGDLVTFVDELETPAMLVSYEKALLGPSGFVAALADFCGVEADPDTFDLAARSVESAPERYLDASRLKFEGRFDNVTDGIASGWVRRLGNSKPMTVVIEREGKAVGREVADRYRKDLERAGKGDGRCAFRIVLTEPDAAKAELTARTEGFSYVLPK